MYLLWNKIYYFCKRFLSHIQDLITQIKDLIIQIKYLFTVTNPDPFHEKMSAHSATSSHMQTLPHAQMSAQVKTSTHATKPVGTELAEAIVANPDPVHVQKKLRNNMIHDCCHVVKKVRNSTGQDGGLDPLLVELANKFGYMYALGYNSDDDSDHSSWYWMSEEDDADDDELTSASRT